MIETESLPSAFLSEPYLARLDGTGGTLPYSWALVRGTLPAGLHLTQASGEITGTPTSYANASFLVQLTDAKGHLARRAFSIAVAAWELVGTLPSALDAPGFASVDGYLVAFGGYKDSAATRETWTAPILADGAIGSWTRQADFTHNGSHQGGTPVSGSFVYSIAGHYGNWYHAKSSYARVVDGAISSWTLLPDFPRMQEHASWAVSGGNLYVIGGLSTNCPSVPDRNVTYAEILSNGGLGPWRESTQLPSALRGAGAVATSDGRIFMMGGDRDSCDNPTDGIWVAQRNADGSIGGWSSAGKLPIPGRLLHNTAMLVGDNSLYVAITQGVNSTNVTRVFRGSIGGTTVDGWEELPAYPVSGDKFPTFAVWGPYLYTMPGNTGMIYRLRILGVQ